MAAEFLIKRKLSERRACALLGISRRWRGYVSRRKDQGLAERLLDLAERHPRYGYRRLHQMLLRQGARVNVKRVRRLCVVLGVKLPMKRRRKRRGIGVGLPVKAEHPNHVWSYDFVFDWCEDGRQLKMLPDRWKASQEAHCHATTDAPTGELQPHLGPIPPQGAKA